MALTPGQLSYWRHKTGNAHLTMAQALKLHQAATASSAADPVAATAPAASPGTPNPPAPPFLTGDQILQQGQAQQVHDTGYQNIADQLAQLALNNQYQQQAIEHGRISGVAGAQDNAAARGVFNSSIKDGQVYDIDAQAATQQQHLIDAMSAAQTSATAQRAILDQALAAATTGFNQSAVENASQIDTGYSSPPVPQQPAGGSQQPAAKPQVPVATGGARQPTSTTPTPPAPSHAFHIPGVGWVHRWL